MPSAHVRVLKRPPYHGDVIERALSGLGFSILPAPSPRPDPGDVLVIWNRYMRDERFASAYEAAGARVVVMENGYFGRDFDGGPWYALSIGQHNGAGKLPPPSADRFFQLGINLSPWRLDGDEIVVLGTRGFGSAPVREPAGWRDRIAERLRRESGRPVRVRIHPGAQVNCDTADLLEDLDRAYAAVTWGSGAGLKALAGGVPVFHGLPHWIGRLSAYRIESGVQSRWTGDRLATFHQVASAMWNLDEIASGEALSCLLAVP